MSVNTEHTTDQNSTCDECSAPVAADQRYCVQCGAHRRTASDPAGRYFSESSAARTRVAAATKSGSAKGRRKHRGAPGLVAAMLVALVPVAAAIGVAIGRSSNNDSQAILNALAKHQVVAAPSSSSSNSGNSGSGSGGSGKTLGGGVSAGGGKGKNGSKKSGGSSSSTNTKVSAKNNSSNQTGSGHGAQVGASINGQQSSQGAKEANQVSKAKGKSYVNEENQLPNAVSP